MLATEMPEIVKDVPRGLELGLRNYWYPVLWSEHVTRAQPVAIKVLGEELVVWREGDGKPSVLYDRCPHRKARLSVGRMLEGRLQCIFHGLRFDRKGNCVLIPWEADDSPLCEEVHVKGYPARDLGGYIWAFIGDTDRFPPPPLEDEVPEELSKPDEFLWFRIPNDVWECNWMLAVDGSDGYHALVLHAETQAVASTEWQGGAVERPTVPLADRRIKLVQASYGLRGVSVDKQGNPIHHGHLLDVKGEKFVMPTINTTPLVTVPGAPPNASRLWQFPLDEHRTHVIRYEVARARTTEERERWTKAWEEVVKPRIESIGPEDKMIAAAQGDLVSARTDEYLFAADMDVLKVRRMLRDAFLAQVEGRRVEPTREALLFPS